MSKIKTAFYERTGINAYIQGRFADAERWFRLLENTEPDSLRVLSNLGAIHLAMGDAQGAETYLLKEERLYGASFKRHAALGDIAYARGKRKEAERRYKLALTMPDAEEGGSAFLSRPIVEARIALCLDDESFARSRESMKRFEEGEEARREGDAEAAIGLYEKAADLDPTNWPALNNAATIAFNTLGDPARAVPLFTRALELGRSPQVARNLVLAEAATAKAEKAAKRAAAKGAKA
jgi:Flp pilus assembly protein TadD